MIILLLLIITMFGGKAASPGTGGHTMIVNHGKDASTGTGG